MVFLYFICNRCIRSCEYRPTRGVDNRQCVRIRDGEDLPCGVASIFSSDQLMGVNTSREEDFIAARAKEAVAAPSSI